METPECQKRRDNEDFIPRRLLCATENPATGNEMMTLPVLACNAGESSWEFYEVVLQEEKHFLSLAFMLSTDIESNQPVVVVTQRELANHPPFGLVSRVQVTITGRKYIVHILMRMWESGELDGRDSIHAVCNKFVANTEYKFCPGLDPEEYQKEYFERIRFHIKSVHETTSPFHRVDLVNCVIWFLLAPNARLAEKKSKQVRCGGCKRLVTDLNCQLQRTLKETPTRKLNRQAVSSRARLTYMSPASQLQRKQNAQTERSNDKLKLAKLHIVDLDLSDEQHVDMCNVTEAIEESGKDEITRVFAEGDAHGVGDVLRNVWHTDMRKQKKQFMADQANNGKWSV